MYIQITTPVGVFRSKSDEALKTNLEETTEFLMSLAKGEFTYLKFKDPSDTLVFFPEEIVKNSVIQLVDE